MSVSESLGERRTIQLSGGPFVYRESGEGEPVVFLHGLLVNGDEWRGVAPSLASNARCIVPDLPFGSHELPMNSDADLSMPAVADLLAEFLTELGIAKATLVGSDAGGVLAQLTIAGHPERLVLVACDAFEDFPPREFRVLKYLPYLPGAMLTISLLMLSRRFRRSRFGYGLTMSADPEPKVVSSYLRPGLKRAIRRDTAKVLKAVKIAITLDAATTFPERSHPVLVVWAGRDHLFKPGLGQRLAGAFPNATLEVIEDSQIYIPEDQPAALAETVASFLATQGASTLGASL